MNMVSHASDAESFASGITGDRGQVGMEPRSHTWFDDWPAIFRSEDDVNNDEA